MEYKKISLKDVVISSNTGADAIQRAPIVDFDTGKRCLRIGDISNHREYENWGFTNVNDENYKKYKLEKDDILIARTGSTIGINQFIDRDLEAVYNNGLIRLRVNKERYNSKYIYYTLQTNKFKNFIESIAFGTTGQPNMKINDLLTFKIVDIPLEKQNKLVDIVSKLDKKIQLNNQINKNLQELTLTLHKQFIEDNNNVDEVLLEDCVKKIGTGADAIQRAPIVNYDTGIRCIRVGDMTNNRKCYEWGFAKMTDKDFNNYKLDIGDIVITRTAVNGIAYLIEDTMKVVCNNGLIRLKVNENYNPLYIFLTMKTKDFYDYIHRIDSETSVRPNMKVDYLKSYRIKKVPLEKQNQFCDIIKTMRKRQKEIEYENNNLIQLRDTLLPKLMNGEIDIDNIEI